jgi:hypothetical protein
MLYSPPYLAELHAGLQVWAPLGEREYSDGTGLIGRLPEKGDGGYLHRLFGPLPDELVEGIERRLGFPVPAALREFYTYHNGCILFDQCIHVLGARTEQ